MSTSAPTVQSLEWLVTQLLRTEEILKYLLSVHGNDHTKLSELIQALMGACISYKMMADSLSDLLRSVGFQAPEELAEPLHNMSLKAVDIENLYLRYLQTHFNSTFDAARDAGDHQLLVIIAQRPKLPAGVVLPKGPRASEECAALVAAREELLRTTEGRAFLVSIGDAEAASLARDDETVSISAEAYAERDARSLARTLGVTLISDTSAAHEPSAAPEDH